MQAGATGEQIDAVIERMVELGFDVHRSTGVLHTVLGGVGGKGETDLEIFNVMEGVKEAHRIASPFKLASRTFHPANTVIRTGGVEIGGERVVVMAGPCSVESAEQIERSAAIVAEAGAAPSSRAARPTPSRAWARRAWCCCGRPPTGTAWWW
jgi:3-deoxy-7-phosphoheptulonate synthase